MNTHVRIKRVSLPELCVIEDVIVWGAVKMRMDMENSIVNVGCILHRASNAKMFSVKL